MLLAHLEGLGAIKAILIHGVSMPDHVLVNVIAVMEASGHSGQEIDRIKTEWLARNPMCMFHEDM
ncbi:hypothetical protein A0H81_00234 [Grifola frondosa]|uniref:Uncharacterized protein n=1 Tax=Grifola frondosa TaxID=5627 RepID=A0A1C7MP36_GRIFR|nr:hypothetical protein A0H81_00234 [Grifola frondosa]